MTYPRHSHREPAAARRTEERLRAALSDAYRIERELGAGGMGTVFLAEDLRHGRKVAIKVLRPDLAASAGKERFLREIRIAAGLQHPNIVGLIDSGEAGDLLYFVMPYVEGSTLRVRLARDGELPIQEGLRLLREIAEALAYAHGRGVVHRDVKPENVLFVAGHAQLADFGVAKGLADPELDAASTATGVAVGSPGYMAPEAAAGAAAIDHRADIYAFGVLAFEVLTGQHPFLGTEPSRHLRPQPSQPVSPLRALRPSLPPELDELISRCLETRPAARWQSAAEIARRLDLVLSSAGGPAARSGAHELTVGRFRLTEEVCRKLQRSSFSPRMIGDEIEYLDNGVSSDVLVCFVHAIGLDGADFEPQLRSLPYRGIAPTFYGFEPARRRRFTLPLDDHLLLVRELVNAVASRQAPSTIVVVGFSSGADVALRLAIAAAAAPAAHVDGVLALGCNLALETCFVTQILARLEDGEGAGILADLHALAGSIRDLDGWLSIHSYLVRMLRKFRLQVDPLRTFARDILRPFQEEGEDPFARWYREVTAAGSAVTCLFEDTESCNRLLRDVQLRNLDSRVLGDRYREGSLIIVPEADHFDLLDPDLVLRHVDELVRTIGESGSRTTVVP
ncbi:MAG: serine/threonine-protein kinase [Thermoanaerobaculia bacterium]